MKIKIIYKKINPNQDRYSLQARKSWIMTMACLCSMVVRISHVKKVNEREYFISNERHYQFKYKSTSSKYNIFVWKKDGGLYTWEEDWYTIYDPHYSFGKQST